VVVVPRPSVSLRTSPKAFQAWRRTMVLAVCTLPRVIQPASGARWATWPTVAVPRTTMASPSGLSTGLPALSSSRYSYS
jgi:hypothetical protein